MTREFKSHQGFQSMKGRTWKDEQLAEAVESSFSMANALRYLGLRPTGGNYKSIHKHIRRLDLDIEHFTGQGHLKGKRHGWTKKRPLDEILVKNSDYLSTCHLKERLLKEDKLKYECYKCTIKSWQRKRLSLQLDHINGINTDNRLENLRLLCPNCHSQTKTFTGKNLRGRVQTGKGNGLKHHRSI